MQRSVADQPYARFCRALATGNLRRATLSAQTFSLAAKRQASQTCLRSWPGTIPLPELRQRARRRWESHRALGTLTQLVGPVTGRRGEDVGQALLRFKQTTSPFYEEPAITARDIAEIITLPSAAPTTSRSTRSSCDPPHRLDDPSLRGAIGGAYCPEAACRAEPVRPSKPEGRCSPSVGGFDSCAPSLCRGLGPLGRSRRPRSAWVAGGQGHRMGSGPRIARRPCLSINAT